MGWSASRGDGCGHGGDQADADKLGGHFDEDGTECLVSGGSPVGHGSDVDDAEKLEGRSGGMAVAIERQTLQAIW